MSSAALHTSRPAIAYYRVSTARQGESGLGLEAQSATVANYALGAGLEVAEEFTEVESGRKANRPQLAEALATAKRMGAVLVIAKLDRLSRNVAFISTLMDSGVDLVACDNPNANRLTLHILAAVAEEEARAISVRTKAALAAAKARGVELGKNGKVQGPKLAKANKAAAQRFAEEQSAVVQELDGLTLKAMAEELNRQGIATPRGGRWHVTSAKRLRDRVRGLEVAQLAA